jgi:hypothetical protein
LTLGGSPYLNTTYGFNALTQIPTQTTDANGVTTTGNYIINFYVQPSMQQIAEANNCWPAVSTSGKVASILAGVLLGGPIGGIVAAGGATTSSAFSNPLPGAELADIFYLLNPLTNIGSNIGQLVTSGATLSSGTFYLPAYCPPQGGLATNLEMLNAYGIIGVTSYFMPIINLIMTMSAIVGMSALMGGDTRLEGLSRFI